MNEKLVFKRSALIFLIGFVIFLIVGFIMKSVSYPLGFLLGYLFNLAIFYVIIITSDIILNKFNYLIKYSQTCYLCNWFFNCYFYTKVV